MSASILWEPVNDNPKSIGCWAPSAFQDTMERAGLGLPVTLGSEHIGMLKGMAATMRPPQNNDAAPNPYQELIDVILANGAINIWAQH